MDTSGNTKMSIEQKAKAYDEALERARELRDKALAYNANHYVKDYETIFPALKESEDEKIRKMCIAAVNIAASADGGLLHSEASECLAWLEEQKDKNCLACDQHLKGYIAGRKVTEEEKQKEQKPVQSEDEREYVRILKSIVSDFIRDKKPEDVAYYQRIYDWLDGRHIEQKPAEKEITLNGFEKVLDSFLFDFVHSPIIDCEPKEYIKNHSAYLLKAAYKELNAQLKQDFFEAQQEGRREGYEAAMAEQNPAEWSEEDELMRTVIIQTLERFGGRGTTGMQIDWLKSLRPQPNWKPSEEQMEALRLSFEEAFDDAGDCNRYRILKSLYEQLKNL